MGSHIYFFFFTNLDVSLKKQFIIHNIKYLAGTVYVGASLKHSSVWSFVFKKRKKLLSAINEFQNVRLIS